MTAERLAINNYIEGCENNGSFDIHTTNPDFELSLPVDESYERELLNCYLSMHLKNNIFVK